MSDSDDWWKLVELNLRAPADLTRAVLPSMLERKSGTIICTVSRAAIGNGPYSSVRVNLKIELNVRRITFQSQVYFGSWNLSAMNTKTPICAFLPCILRQFLLVWVISPK